VVDDSPVFEQDTAPGQLAFNTVQPLHRKTLSFLAWPCNSPELSSTDWRRKIADNCNRLSRVHERYRRQTDGLAIAYSSSRSIIKAPHTRRHLVMYYRRGLPENHKTPKDAARRHRPSQNAARRRRPDEKYGIRHNDSIFLKCANCTLHIKLSPKT